MNLFVKIFIRVQLITMLCYFQVHNKVNQLCCCCSVAQLYPTLCDPIDCSMPDFLSFTVSWSSLKLMSIKYVMPSNHLVLCYPLFLPPSIFPSVRVFSNESVLPIRWLKYWSFSFRTDLLQDELVGSPCSPRDSQESSTPWFKSINSSVLSFLYSPILTSIPDYWKYHSFDQMDLCCLSNVSAF